MRTRFNLLTLWQVERFASRMAKYQDNEDKMTEDYSRAKIEAEKAKEKLERVTLVCSILYSILQSRRQLQC
jgi:hypothetical protein